MSGISKKSTVFFEEKTSPEIGQYAKDDALVIIPVGMIEEHGPHLPVSTDNIIARGISEQIAERIADRIPVLVMPCVFTGYHGRIMMKWPGSTTVRPESLYNYVYDIMESLCKNGFRKIMIINAHGQNPAIFEMVCRRIADAYGIVPILTYAMGMIGPKGASIRTSSQGGAGGHGCEIETSLVLSLAEELVDMSKASDGIGRNLSLSHRIPRGRSVSGSADRGRGVLVLIPFAELKVRDSRKRHPCDQGKGR